MARVKVFRPRFRGAEPNRWEVSDTRNEAEQQATWFGQDGLVNVIIRPITLAGKRRFITEGWTPGWLPGPRQRNPEGLYQAFHGAEPIMKKVVFEPPQGRLIKIGRLIQLEYQPEPPSKRTGTQYYHSMGDLGGSQHLKSNSILCTDESGQNLFIIKDKPGKWPRFSNRGILG